MTSTAEGPDSLRLLSSFVIIICVYSFIINCAFGHKTFWRSSPWYLWTKFRSVWMRYVDPLQPSICWMNECMTSLETLDNNLVINTFQFLTPFDLLNVGRTSKKMYMLSSHKYLWKQKSQSLVDRAERHLPTSLIIWKQLNLISKFSEKIIFFELYNELRTSLLEKSLSDPDSCFVLINGNIYDVSHFINEHPGGPAVLLDWKGKDASTSFFFAHHSQFARTESKKYLIWSKQDILGVIAG
jgi:cytochrome b involved in lipid metabolism